MNRGKYFNYQRGELFCESTPISEVVRKLGTPLYLYSYHSLINNYREVRNAFHRLSPLICYALKANGNLTISRLLAREGAGCDIVSGGELYKALRAGFSPQRIVFAGPGKNEKEIEYALKENILILNVESASELKLIEQIAQRMSCTARISLRINPDVDAGTHHYITTGKNENKFGICFEEAKKLYLNIKNSSLLQPAGIHFHLGSQITSLQPYLGALEKILDFLELLKEKGLNLKYMDIGGGFGISYEEGKPPLNIKELAERIHLLIKNSKMKLILEPGRFLVGPAGSLITEVLYKKNRGEKTFIIADAGMNDLIRPSLYGAFHQIKKLKEPYNKDSLEVIDVVGPICESGDFFAKERKLPPIKEGEYLAIMDAGAYGFSMSSSYNARPRPSEVLIKDDCWWIIRERETYPDLIRGEHIPDELFSS
jgi:diaminopimelate decarboxylase